MKYSFKPIRKIPWAEVWHDYKKLEEDHWREHYQSRGFKTWEEFRRKYWDLIKPESRSWQLLKISDPKSDVPHFYVGPFRGWRKYYSDRDHSTFADIAKLRLENENEIPVKYFVENFPPSARFIGLKFQDKIMIMEGSHRSLAISIIALQNKNLNSQIEIAITELDQNDQELFKNLWNYPIQVPFEHEL